MSQYRKLIRDFVLYGLTSSLSKTISLILLPVLTRVFTVQEFGVADILITFYSLTTLIIGMTLDSAIIRNWYQLDNIFAREKYAKTILLTIITFGLIVLIMIIPFSDSFSNILFGSIEYRYHIVTMTIAAIFFSAATVPKAILRLNRKIISFNVLGILHTVSYTISVIMLVFYAEFSVFSVPIGMLLSSTITLIVSLYLIRNDLQTIFLKFDSKILCSAIAYSLPLLPAVIVTWLNNQIDKLLILNYLNIEDVAIFSAPAKLAVLILLIVAVFRQAWGPNSIEAIKLNEVDRNNFYQHSFKMYIYILISISIILLILSKSIILAIFPVDYYYGFVVIPWILAAHVLHGLADITNLGTIITKRTWSNSLSAWIGFSINLTLGLILIPKYGIAAAAFGTFIAELIYVSILWYVSEIQTSIRFNKTIFFFSISFYLLITFIYLL